MTRGLQQGHTQQTISRPFFFFLMSFFVSLSFHKIEVGVSSSAINSPQFVVEQRSDTMKIATGTRNEQTVTDSPETFTEPIGYAYCPGVEILTSGVVQLPSLPSVV